MAASSQASIASSAPKLTDFRVNNPNVEQLGEAETLRQALAKRGINPEGIGVFALPTADGMTTVITRLPDEFVITGPSASVYQLARIESALPSEDLPMLPLRSGVAAADSGAEWVRNNADCDIYSTDGFARTQCFEINEQAGDSDGRRSFWQYTAEASGHSKGHRDMYRLWVERRPTNGSPRQKFDGIPEPKEARSQAENCVQETEVVEIESGAPVEVGFSHEWSRLTCETYRPKMYGDEGHWATIWEGNPDVGPKDIRHVLFTMPVNTVEGALPSWTRLNGQYTR